MLVSDVNESLNFKIFKIRPEKTEVYTNKLKITSSREPCSRGQYFRCLRLCSCGGLGGGVGWKGERASQSPRQPSTAAPRPRVAPLRSARLCAVLQSLAKSFVSAKECCLSWGAEQMRARQLARMHKIKEVEIERWCV